MMTAMTAMMMIMVKIIDTDQVQKTRDTDHKKIQKLTINKKYGH